MTAEAAYALTQPGPVSSRAGMAYIPMQRRHREHISCDPPVQPRKGTLTRWPVTR